MKRDLAGRNHHFVPVTYLKSWCDENGHLMVTYAKGDKTVNFKKNPERFRELTKQGYYNLRNPDGTLYKDYWLLEKVMFGNGDGKIFSKKTRS